ncbi:MAG: MATE family efflux transporter [Muribaculaceae bacterium]|nr:MATE family efflux transporter [Muribaculaceae bacterium]
MALPTIISMMVTSLYNIADTFFVSKINTQTTAAVGIIFSFMAILQAMGFLFGYGTGNYVAIKLGANDRKEAEKMAVTGYFYALCVAVFLTVTGIIFINPLCRILGCTPTILPYAEAYMLPILLGAPFIIGALTLNVQIRQQGNAAYAMTGIVSGAVLNIILDPLFIFTFNLGIRGAGFATLISQAVSFSILTFMTSKGGNMPLKFRNLSFEGRYIKAIFRGGTPSLTRQGLGSIATLLLNLTAGMFGDAAIAGMTVVTRMTFLVYSVVIGLGQGYQPLCSFCYGAALYQRVIKGFWFCTAIGTLFLSCIAIIGSVYADEIIRAFRDDPDVIKVGHQALLWQLAAYPIGAITMYSNMAMQSMNLALRANILAAARRGLFFIPFLMVLPRLYGLDGLTICQPLADLCAFLVSVPVLVYTFRQLRYKVTTA